MQNPKPYHYLQSRVQLGKQLLHLQPLLHDKQCTNGNIASQPKLYL